jgi:membrane protein implicated in regulation of membrane protease activity
VPQWAVWVIAAVALLGIEAAAGTFYLFWVASAALLGGLTTMLLPADPRAPWVVFALAAATLTGAMRAFARKGPAAGADDEGS